MIVTDEQIISLKIKKRLHILCAESIRVLCGTPKEFDRGNSISLFCDCDYLQEKPAIHHISPTAIAS